MLRALVAALLLANVGFFAWTQGWLDGVVGAGTRSEREPERLRQQVRPEALRIVTPEAASAAAAASAASAASAAAAAARTCLEAGPFSGTGVSPAAVTALKSLDPPVPETAWTDVATERPGRWTVYMGRYAGAEALAKKEDELRRRHLDFEEIRSGPLAPGLSLGRHDDRQAATDALDTLTRQGIHTARVVQETAASTAHVLRFDAAGPALAARLSALKGEPWGEGFTACAPAKAN